MPPRHVKGVRGSRPQNVGGAKTRQKIVKMNDLEAVKARYLAVKAGLSFSEYVRELIRREWDALEEKVLPGAPAPKNRRTKAR